MAADGKRRGFGLNGMNDWWAAQAARLAWVTHALLFAVAIYVGYSVYFDDHLFFAARNELTGITPVSAGVLLVGLAAAAWLGLTHAALYRRAPPDPDRAIAPGISGALRDRLSIMGPPLLSFITLIAIIWYGYSHTVPRLLHMLSPKTPMTLTMVMNGDYTFNGSPRCATATGYVDGYGFVTICLPESLRDDVERNYGVKLAILGKASPYGFGITDMALR